MKKQLVKYVRNEKRQPIGLIVSFVENEKIYIGWSKCSKRDVWSKELGQKIAFSRAYFHGDNPTVKCEVAYSVKSDFIKMAERSERFFKGAVLPDSVKEILGTCLI